MYGRCAEGKLASMTSICYLSQASVPSISISSTCHMSFLWGINMQLLQQLTMSCFSCAGWRESFDGDLQMYGKMGVQFFTKTKVQSSLVTSLFGTLCMLR